MPYKIKGATVYHKKGSKWTVKQKCSTPENAKKAVKLLYGVEHGMVPKSKKTKKR